MKKILVIFVAVICSVFCAYKVIASSNVYSPRSGRTNFVPINKSKKIDGRLVLAKTVEIPADCGNTMYDLLDTVQDSCAKSGDNMKLATPETYKDIFKNHFADIKELGLVSNEVYLTDKLSSKDGKLYIVNCVNASGDIQCTSGVMPGRATRYPQKRHNVLCVAGE